MALLELRGVAKSFGTLRALDGVDLDVAEGAFHGLIGPNGSGKSTLLKAIAGEHFPDSGSVALAGTSITGAPPDARARAGLAIKFQITAVMKSLSVYDNLLLAMQADARVGALLRSRTRHGLDGRVRAQLAAFRLDARADDVAGTLSHGEQQWLEIAMALALGPRLLLLDEPTAGMGAEERRVTGALLEPLRGRCALLIVEHDIDWIKGFCTEISVLDAGRVLDHGTVDHIERSERVADVFLRRA